MPYKGTILSDGAGLLPRTSIRGDLVGVSRAELKRVGESELRSCLRK